MRVAALMAVRANPGVDATRRCELVAFDGATMLRPLGTPVAAHDEITSAPLLTPETPRGSRRDARDRGHRGPAPAFPPGRRGPEGRAMAEDGGALTAEDLRTLEGLLAKLGGPGAELPWPLFRFVTEVAATSNVDLLVADPGRGVLLSWRDDPFGAGWHVPGSIVRHREEIAHRVAACARDEFGCDVEAELRAIALVQIFDDRGHSVSICYRASLRGEPGRRVVGEGEAPAPGDLRWFQTPPADLYPSHRVYRDVVAALGRGELDGGAPLFTQHVGRRDAAQASPEGEIAAVAPLA